MLGYVEHRDCGTGIRLEKRGILGGTFLVLSLGKTGRMGYLYASLGARRMRRCGVRRAVFPAQFPYTALFLRQGIVPMDTMPLRRALCASYVRRRMEELGIPPTEAVIAVAGSYLGSEMAETVRTLALAFRYVLLSVPEGGETLARHLRRQYGISLILHPARDQLERADALILFSPAEGVSCGNRVLCNLYPGGEQGVGCVPIALSGELERELPPDCDRDQMAAALHAMGIVGRENTY